MVKVLTSEGQKVFNELKVLENLWHPDQVPQADEYFKKMDELSEEREIDDKIPEDWLRLIETAHKLKKQGKTNKEIMELLFPKKYINI